MLGPSKSLSSPEAPKFGQHYTSKYHVQVKAIELECLQVTPIEQAINNRPDISYQSGLNHNVIHVILEFCYNVGLKIHEF